MKYSQEQLNSAEFLKTTKQTAEDIIIYDQINDAYRLAKDLESSLDAYKDFKDRNHEFFNEYNNIIHRLKWIALPIMTEEMVIKMFQYHFAQIFHLPDFDFNRLWQKLRLVLLANLIFADRDVFKGRLKQALLNNQEQLTSNKLITNNQEKSSTVGNWIFDYNSNLGTGVADNLKKTQYFTNGINIKKLNQEEKNKVKFLFDIYEKLKLSSQTLEGLEEEIPIDDPGREGIIKNGVFEPYKELEKIKSANVQNKQKQSSELDDFLALLDKYPAGSLERKAIEEEIAKLKKEKEIKL